MSRNWWSGLQGIANRVLARKSHRIRNDAPLVSFTFDDFARSAFRVGGGILEEHDARGTYYVSWQNLNGTLGPKQHDSFRIDDIQELVTAGHELGCHTHSHWDCGARPWREVVEDVGRNAAEVAEVLPEVTLQSFSYPSGKASPAVKRALSERFTTCRGVMPGINRGRIDLAGLHANAIYGGDGFQERALGLVEDVARGGGWLIFYTHEVSEDTGPHGCTPRQLEAVVRAAKEAGCRILPVRNAVGALAFPAEL